MNTENLNNVKTVIGVTFARLRFVAVFVVAALLIGLTLIPTVVKRLTKRADAVRPYR